MTQATLYRVFAALLLVALPSLAHAQTWWNTDWTWRRSLVLGDASITAEQTDFPVMVKLDTSRMPYTTTKSGGADLRFVANDQTTVLDHEIEVWNPSGTSIVWVRVPTLADGATSATIWMYWGNAAASDGQDVPGVWKTEYEVVWHLENLTESTDANGALTANGGAATTTGTIGGGYVLDGVDDYLSQSVDLGTWMTDADGTLEFWIKTDDAGTSNPDSSGAVGLMGVHAGGGGTDDYHIGWIKSGTPKSLCISAEDAGGRCAVNTSTDPDATAVDGTWHYVVFERDGVSSGAGDVDVYLDGVRVQDNQAAGGGAGGVTFTDIGRIKDLASSNLAASLDEIRILSTKVTPSWVAANYLSQTDGLIGWTCSATTYYRDADGDTYGDPAVSVATCASPRTGSGWVTNDTDCDDTDELVNPDTLWYVDGDGDGYGVSGSSIAQCTDPSNGTTSYAPQDGDNCDDEVLAWGAVTCTTCSDDDLDLRWELCDTYTIDGPDCDDTNNRTWDSCLTCADVDTDGWWGGCNAYPDADGPDNCDGSAVNPVDLHNHTTTGCAQCNDSDGDERWEQCDTYTPVQALVFEGQDFCDGQSLAWTSGACATCTDADGDTAFDNCDTYTVLGEDNCDTKALAWTSGACATCVDNDGDGSWVSCDIPGAKGVDCSDTNNRAWNTCATCADDDTDTWWDGCNEYPAADGPDACDGSPTNPIDRNNHTVSGCACDDDDLDKRFDGCDAYAYTDAAFLGQDHCDTNPTDPVGRNNWTSTACSACKDTDLDDYWVACDSYAFTVVGVFEGQDCLDSDPLVNPETAWFLDDDGDGYGSTTAYSGNPVCEDPGADWVLSASDCNDADPAINPATVWYKDKDEDGWGSSSPADKVTQCADPSTAQTQYVLNGADCNDNNADVTTGLWFRDFDGDTFGDALVTAPGCTQPGGYVANDDDCNDQVASIKPGGVEICGDGIDSNCDTVGGPNGDDDGDGITFAKEDAWGADDCADDSDNDDVTDTVEWGNLASTTPRDTDGDDVPDIVDTDDDGDGLLTEIESHDDLDGAPACGFAPDGKPSYIDVDSDGDGVCDGFYVPVGAECTHWEDFDRDAVTAGVQAFPEAINLDNDTDGVPNAYDYDDFDGGACDADGDGLGSLVENGICFTPVGGSEVCLDPSESDTNHDGVDDGAEVGPNVAQPRDTDGDDIPDWWDLDDDGDLVPTLDEDYDVPPDGDPTNDDSDGDGTDDYLDTDDDNDGVLTKHEDRDGDGDPRNDDTDGDLVPDYVDADDRDGPLGDADGDGVGNAEETAALSDPADADTDGDGVLDGLEWEDSVGATLDTDGDLVRDALDDDDDGDGIPTAVEGSMDVDRDTFGNWLDTDSDGDGLDDRAEGGNQYEADGTLPDADGDGTPDFLDAVADAFDTGGGPGPGPVDDDPGCACSAAGSSASGLFAVGLLALGAVRRRGRSLPGASKPPPAALR